MVLYNRKQKPFHWTAHSKDKMRFYRLSESRVKRVLHSPKRIEEGIAPDTIAVMQPASLKSKIENGKRKEIWTQEIWVMIEETPKQRNVISVWRYPGATKPRSEIALDFLRSEYEEFSVLNLK